MTVVTGKTDYDRPPDDELGLYYYHRAHTMWESWWKPHRLFILPALSALGPSSVFEIACGAGANLRLIRECVPFPIKLGGCDRFAPYATFASRRLGIPITVASLPDGLPTEPWDTILSCFALTYVTEEHVRTILQTVLSDQLIMIEPEESFPDKFAILHPWFTLLRETDWNIIQAWPIPEIHGARRIILATR